jgi:hypothetical protein
MTFTVVRAVRGADSAPAEFSQRLQRLIRDEGPQVAPSSMDLPCAGELLHLDLGDFAPTVPGGLGDDDPTP